MKYSLVFVLLHWYILFYYLWLEHLMCSVCFFPSLIQLLLPPLCSVLLFPLWLCSRYVLLLVILFFVPGVVMSVAYGMISRELFRGMQFEGGQSKEAAGENRH